MPDQPVASNLLTRAMVLLAMAIVVVPGGIVGASMAPGARGHATPLLGAQATGAPPATAVAPASPSAPDPTVLERVHALESALRARGVPARDIHPPDLAAEDPGRVGRAQPSYAQGPAPMGISDLGLRNVSGSLVPYVYNTSSVWGSIDLGPTQSVYVDGDGPDTFSVQLNAVATNITLAGVPGFQFWTQNFFTYTPSTHNLSFGDNVWNFSSASGVMPANVFASFGPNGTLEAPYYYYAVGPSLNVPYPFTVNLYLNAALRDGRPAVYFNYSVVNGSGVLSQGSFDNVTFNSGPAHGAPVPEPAFQVNGTGVDPIGLPNDFELVLVGNDDGDTTTFFAIDATMALLEWSATAHGYATVPAAFDAGSDTGETSNGVLPVYRTLLPGGPPTVSLLPGPSFVEGLWNVSLATDGSRQFHLTQHPQNAFLFVSPGTTFNPSTAQWVPTTHPGLRLSNFSLPNGVNCSLEWMLSDRASLSYNVTNLVPLPNSTAAFTETLSNISASFGSYTPLLAWGDGELPAISQSGNGSAGNPYVLIHRQVGPLNPVFGELNDFGFPVFAGILLINTTAAVQIVQPAVAIDYGSWMAPQLTNLSLPSTNSLQLEFWNVTNVTVRNSTALTGWLSVNLDSFPEAEVLFWGSSGNLVEGNTFHDQGVALALYGGGNNTVWGNTILAASVLPMFDGGNNTTGILEWESGDLLYNNYVDVPVPALTPTFDAFSCQVVCAPATYVDTWNVSLEPANASRSVLGANLTGSILSTWYQGGNYWSNYGTPADPYGTLPYNDHGLITNGGDFVPLTPSPVYAVTFAAQGLVPGARWNVTLLGVTVSSTTTNLVLYAPNGAYNGTVGAPTGYAGPTVVPVLVNGTNLSVPVNFTELFALAFDESGLVLGWEWNGTCRAASLGAVSGSFASAATSGSVGLVNGTYLCSVQARGYASSVVGLSVAVDGGSLSLPVVFSLVAVLVVTASGLPSGTPWSVTITQGSSRASETGVGDGAVNFTVLEINPGPFTWNVSVRGYTASPAGGTASLPSSGALVESVTFVRSPAPGVDPLWIVVGALAVLAAVGFALLALERRRSRRPPKPIVPAAAVAPASAPKATPWDESSGDRGPAPSNPPWEETPGDTERPQPYARRP